MTDDRILYENLNYSGGGIVYAQDLIQRIEIAAKIIKHFRGKWERIFWLAPSTYMRIRDYIPTIKKALDTDAEFVTFCSYEHISLDGEKYLECYDLASQMQGFCVFDESLSIKNLYSARTKRVLAMHRKFKYRLLMSKSPLSCGLLDIYTQMQLINPSAIAMTEAQFRHSYMPANFYNRNVSKCYNLPGAEKTIARLLRPYILYRDWGENIKIIYHNCQFQLDADEQKEYQRDKEQILRGLKNMAYLQVVQRFQYYYTICRQKVKKLQELLEEIQLRNEKVVIYTKFLGEIKFLRESGLLRNKKFAVICGLTNKLRAARLFEADHNILICTYKVEIPRLLLQDCKNVIYFSQTFDYKDKYYPLSRVYGSENCSLNVYDFWVDTELENLIKTSLTLKKQVLENVCETIEFDKVL